MTKKKLKVLTFAIIFIVSYLYTEFSNSQENLNDSPSGTINTFPIPSTLGVSNNAETVSTTSANFKVLKVIDGDTIEVINENTQLPANSQKVRYIGIDTPETVDSRRGVGCFGREAAEKNKELVLNKSITLEKDVSETDKFGRLLRYVYFVDEKTGQRLMVNDELVRHGFARASTYPPDVKYQKIFLDSETRAKDSGLGLWSACR